MKQRLIRKKTSEILRNLPLERDDGEYEIPNNPTWKQDAMELTISYQNFNEFIKFKQLGEEYKRWLETRNLTLRDVT